MLRYKYYVETILPEILDFSTNDSNIKLLSKNLNINEKFVNLFYLHNLNRSKFLEYNYRTVYSSRLIKYQMHLIYQIYKDSIDLTTFLSQYKFRLDDISIRALELLACNDVKTNLFHTGLNTNTTSSSINEHDLFLIACIASYRGYIYWFETISNDTCLVTRKIICAFAALGNQFECLVYLHEHGYCWDEDTAIFAARVGNLACLEYAFSNGCPYTGFEFIEAAANGHLHCLEYLSTKVTQITVIQTAYNKALENQQIQCQQYIEHMYPKSFRIYEVEQYKIAYQKMKKIIQDPDRQVKIKPVELQPLWSVYEPVQPLLMSGLSRVPLPSVTTQEEPSLSDPTLEID